MESTNALLESPKISSLPGPILSKTTETSSTPQPDQASHVEKGQLIRNDQRSKLLATTTGRFNSRPHDLRLFMADFIWRRMFNLAAHNISRVFCRRAEFSLYTLNLVQLQQQLLEGRPPKKNKEVELILPPKQKNLQLIKLPANF